jgi:c-di-GMP-binding flagellar brake protein YcgR
MDSSRFVPSLAVGQRLEVGVGADGTVRWFASRVEDFEAGAQRLTVAWPSEQGRQLVLRVGDTVDLAVSAQDALYSAQVRITVAHNQAVPLLDVVMIGPWQRSQRRQAVRVPVAIRPSLAERVLPDGRQPIRAGITNLSATGLQLRSQDELDATDRLALTFPLGDSEDELSAEAEVRRLVVDERGSVRIWEAGCHFVDMETPLSERIVQFIFAQQRAMARLQRS